MLVDRVTPAPAGSGPAAAGPAVSLRGASAFFGPTCAVRDVTLAAPPRAVTALIGPSGCGKTTLLRSINRLNDAAPGYRVEGSIQVHGEEVYSSRVPVEHLRRRVGMLFQRPAPLPLSIYDDVAYGPRLHRLAAGRAELDTVVEQCLRSVSLWDEVKDRLKQPGRSLSGGQQQRLCLARVLAVWPEVILMDEPCSALDPIATAKIEELIGTLSHEVTIIIVTHNMQQARRIADHTAVMLLSERGGGELAEFGPTTAIFEQPRDPRTRAYVEGRFG